MSSGGITECDIKRLIGPTTYYCYGGIGPMFEELLQALTRTGTGSATVNLTTLPNGHIKWSIDEPPQSTKGG